MDNETPTETPKKPSRGIMANLKGLGFTVMILAALWIALRYVLTPMVLPSEPVVPQSEISAYEERIKALEDKMAGLEAPIDIAPLERRISELETKPAAAVEGGAAVNPEALDALKAEVEKIKTANHVTLQTILLVSQLQEAVRAGRPFTDELNALEALRPEWKEILTPIEPSSMAGIATLEQLKLQFAQSINPTLTQEAGDRSLMQNLRSLVKIRKVGDEQKGLDDEAIIARAEAKLAAGDVAASLQETENLSTRAARNFEAWQERAKNHLAAFATLAKLKAQLARGVNE
jgi:hypothetical protein